MPPEPQAPHERRARMPTPPPGGEPKKSPRRQFMRPGFLGILLALLVANWLLVTLGAPPEPSVTVPYSPYFLNQVNADNVKRINAIGETVTGEFNRKVHFPDPGSTAATKFKTEIPAFANGDKLEAQLRAH